MIANNEIPPYTRLVGSMTDGTECLRSYTVLMESDRKRSTASLSLTERQRVSAPTARVAANSRIQIVDRFCISQDSLRRSPGNWGRSRSSTIAFFLCFYRRQNSKHFTEARIKMLDNDFRKKWISNVAGNKTAGPDRSRGKRSGCRS